MLLNLVSHILFDTIVIELNLQCLIRTNEIDNTVCVGVCFSELVLFETFY